MKHLVLFFGLLFSASLYGEVVAVEDFEDALGDPWHEEHSTFENYTLEDGIGVCTWQERVTSTNCNLGLPYFDNEGPLSASVSGRLYISPQTIPGIRPLYSHYQGGFLGPRIGATFYDSGNGLEFIGGNIGHPSDGTNGWLVYMGFPDPWEPGNVVQEGCQNINVYVYAATQDEERWHRGPWAQSVSVTCLEPGRWYDVQMIVVVNEKGSDNGEIRIYIDGELVTHLEKMGFTDAPVNITRLWWLGTQGRAYISHTIEAYRVDDIVMRTSLDRDWTAVFGNGDIPDPPDPPDPPVVNEFCVTLNGEVLGCWEV